MLKVSEKATRFNSERSFQRYRARVRKVQKLQPSFCLESHVSFNSRPNVRGTLVAVEKAASHSVSLSTIIVWGARSRFKGLQAHLAELLDSQ